MKKVLLTGCLSLCLASGLMVAQRADLIIKNLSYKPPNMAAKDPTTFTAVIQNIGKAPSPPCQLSFRVGGESKAKIFDIQSLGPGSSTTRWRVVQLPYNGRYRITARIDITNQVIERKETNNGKSIIYRPGKPDFIVEKITLSNPRPRVGQRVTIQAIVKNSGEGFVSPYVVALRVGGESKPLLIRVHPPGLHYSIPVQRTFRSKRKGRFIITATADPDNDWKEVQENNNRKTATLIYR